MEAYPNDKGRWVTLLVLRIGLWLILAALLMGVSCFAGIEALILSKATGAGPGNPEGIRVLSFIALIGGVCAVGFVHAVRFVLFRMMVRRGSWQGLAIAYPIGKVVTWMVCDGVIFFSLVVALIAQSFWPTWPIAAGAWLVMAGDWPLFLPFGRLKAA